MGMADGFRITPKILFLLGFNYPRLHVNENTILPIMSTYDLYLSTEYLMNHYTSVIEMFSLSHWLSHSKHQALLQKNEKIQNHLDDGDRHVIEEVGSQSFIF